MKKIGLTGGIGSGKSTVARMLSDHNIPIIDADLIARSIVEPGTPTPMGVCIAPNWPGALSPPPKPPVC